MNKANVAINSVEVGNLETVFALRSFLLVKQTITLLSVMLPLKANAQNDIHFENTNTISAALKL